MRPIQWQLEQQFECRSLECELEQQSDEFEQQCQFSVRLQFRPQTSKEDSGITGMCYPALGEIKLCPPFW